MIDTNRHPAAQGWKVKTWFSDIWEGMGLTYEEIGQTIMVMDGYFKAGTWPQETPDRIYQAFQKARRSIQSNREYYIARDGGIAGEK